MIFWPPRSPSIWAPGGRWGIKCCIFDDFSLCYSRSVTLKYATNAFAAGAPPRTPLGELTTLPRPLVGWRGGYPLPHPTPLGACGVSTLSPVGDPPNVVFTNRTLNKDITTNTTRTTWFKQLICVSPSFLGISWQSTPWTNTTRKQFNLICG